MRGNLEFILRRLEGGLVVIRVCRRLEGSVGMVVEESDCESGFGYRIRTEL